MFKGSNIRALSLGILCFQGFGIRIFEGVIDGAIVLWFVLLVILNWGSVRKVPVSYWLKGCALCIFYLLFCMLKSVQPAYFLIVGWLSGMVVMANYYDGKCSFVEDIRNLARFCMYYSLLHVLVALFFGNLIFETSFPLHPRTFCYLFYFNNHLGIMDIPRIQGFCWEPSCWNLFLNLNLVFTLWFKEGKTILFLSILAIVTVMSTTGLVVMVVAIGLYYLICLQKRNLFKSIITVGLIFAVVFPFMYSELENKLSMGAGQSRMGDFAIATAVIERNPWLGEDLDNITHIYYAMQARKGEWTSNGDYEGYMRQGFVNAFASLFVEWGVPLTLLLFILMYQSPLFPEKKLRFLYISVLLCVIMGTPISRTGFFYMYAFSTMLLPKNKIKETSNLCQHEEGDTLHIQIC